MRLQFDPKQAFQLDAIKAVVDLFEGQPRVQAGINLEWGSGLSAVPNRLDLRSEELLENLRAVQKRNKITKDAQLQLIEQEVEGVDGSKPWSFYNYSVEMETGTGKTYVYLRTILELFERYGLRKFIIVVPRVAIREGAIKTLQITRDHFRELYGSLPYRFYAYDSGNVAQVRQFAMSDAVEIMVMTIDSFNKASNVIRQSLDRLQGETPLHLIQAAHPVLILDEPQNMESEKSIEALALLKPLMALRYSATHRNPYNVVYRLTPYEAYRQGLVKRVEVASVVSEGDTARPYIRIDEIRVAKKTLTARITVRPLSKSGTIGEKTFTVKPGDSLEAKTNRPEYRGWEIDEINRGADYVRFANNQELATGEEVGANKHAIFEAQIRYTVEEHLRKQARLRERGIKVLSLFFIDRVANYAEEDGIIRRLFVQTFEELRARFPEWTDFSAEEVQGYYFAHKRADRDLASAMDSKTGEAQRDQEVYDLILRDKERLLSFEEPVSFIFSHSALREGWDNPNIFQICTLNQSVSETRKRQEVGRGVRLAVGQDGLRVPDEAVNRLTVVANESYQRFVAQYQHEIAVEYQEEIEHRYGKSIDKLSGEERAAVEAEYGTGILPPPPANARERVQVEFRKQHALKPEFKALWERIQKKTRYAVRVDSEQLIEEVVKALAGIDIDPPRVAITKVELEASPENVFEALQLSGAKTMVDLEGRYPLPNLVDILANLMEQTTPSVRLTRRTLLEILRRAPHPMELVQNLHEFALQAARAIKERLADQLVKGIRYEPIGEVYEARQLEVDIETWLSMVEPVEKSVYSHVIYDSAVERRFARDLEKMNQVQLYLKLPAWFTVPTPIGTYNPDWAIVWEDRDAHGEPTGELLFLVCETKGQDEIEKLRISEQRKVYCAKRHFEGALDVRYEQTSTAQKLF